MSEAHPAAQEITGPATPPQDVDAAGSRFSLPRLLGLSRRVSGWLVTTGLVTLALVTGESAWAVGAIVVLCAVALEDRFSLGQSSLARSIENSVAEIRPFTTGRLDRLEQDLLSTRGLVQELRVENGRLQAAWQERQQGLLAAVQERERLLLARIEAAEAESGRARAEAERSRQAVAQLTKLQSRPQADWSLRLYDPPRTDGGLR